MKQVLKITILLCVDSGMDLYLWYIIYINYFTELLKIFVVVRTLYSFGI